jgi:putative transposon-encoded protein
MGSFNISGSQNSSIGTMSSHTTVKIVGNSGGVGVPKAWLGKRVKVVLLEE